MSRPTPGACSGTRGQAPGRANRMNSNVAVHVGPGDLAGPLRPLPLGGGGASGSAGVPRGHGCGWLPAGPRDSATRPTARLGRWRRYRGFWPVSTRTCGEAARRSGSSYHGDQQLVVVDVEDQRRAPSLRVARRSSPPGRGRRRGGGGLRASHRYRSNISHQPRSMPRAGPDRRALPSRSSAATGRIIGERACCPARALLQNDPFACRSTGRWSSTCAQACRQDAGAEPAPVAPPARTSASGRSRS